jgi:hypothetical protein
MKAQNKKGENGFVLPFVRKRNTEQDYRSEPLLPVLSAPVLAPLPLFESGRTPWSLSERGLLDDAPLPAEEPLVPEELLPIPDEPLIPDELALTPRALVVSLSSCPVAFKFFAC